MPEDKDPWKDPPQEPELDLWLKKLRARWGRRRPEPRDPWRGLRRNHRITLFIPFAIVLVFWLSTGFVNIPPGRVGYPFVLAQPAGPLGTGPHWLPPWPLTRVLVAVAPSRGTRLLRMHALTAEGRLLVVRLRYRIREPHPRQAVLSYSGLSRLRRARLRHILLRLLATVPLKKLGVNQKIQTIRADLIRRWSGSVTPVQGSTATPGHGHAVPWGRLEIRGLSLGSPRPLRPQNVALADLAQRQKTLLLRVRSEAKTRLALARLEAEALLAQEHTADEQILARAQNRIAVFRALLPAYRRDPLLARRLLALELLRRGIGTQRVTLSFGKELRVVLGPIVPAPRVSHTPVHGRPKPPKPPRGSASSSRGSL